MTMAFDPVSSPSSQKLTDYVSPIRLYGLCNVFGILDWSPGLETFLFLLSFLFLRLSLFFSLGVEGGA